MPPRRWMRQSGGQTISPSRRRVGQYREVLFHGAAGDGDAVAMQEAGLEELAQDDGHATDPIEMVMWNRPGGCGNVRDSVRDALHSSSSSCDLHLVGDREEVQHRVGREPEEVITTAMAFSNTHLDMMSRGARCRVGEHTQ